MKVKEAVPLREGWKLTIDKGYIHVEIQCRSLTLNISILSHIYLTNVECILFYYTY